MDILETEQDRHGKRLWHGRRFNEARRALRSMLEVPGPPPLPRHRIGEAWGRPFVVRLASCFKRYGVSQLKRITSFHEAVVLSGRGDVVSRDIVRPILRAVPGGAGAQSGGESLTSDRAKCLACDERVEPVVRQTIRGEIIECPKCGDTIQEYIETPLPPPSPTHNR